MFVDINRKRINPIRISTESIKSFFNVGFFRLLVEMSGFGTTDWGISTSETSDLCKSVVWFQEYLKFIYMEKCVKNACNPNNTEVDSLKMQEAKQKVFLRGCTLMCVDQYKWNQLEVTNTLLHLLMISVGNCGPT
jgi:hypothetical protein